MLPNSIFKKYTSSIKMLNNKKFMTYTAQKSLYVQKRGMFKGPNNLLKALGKKNMGVNFQSKRDMAVLPVKHKPRVNFSADGKLLTTAQKKHVNLLDDKTRKSSLIYTKSPQAPNGENNEFLSNELYDETISSSSGQFVGKVPEIEIDPNNVYIEGRASLYTDKHESTLQKIIDKHNNGKK